MHIQKQASVLSKDLLGLLIMTSIASTYDDVAPNFRSWQNPQAMRRDTLHIRVQYDIEAHVMM